MISWRRFALLTFVLLATLVGVGVAHGIWTERWPTAAPAELLSDFEKIPLTIGKWDGKTLEDKTTQKVFGDSNNYLLRRYVNHLDGTVGSVMFTRGRPGPMLIKHLPTECYISAGYEIVGQPKRYVSAIADSKANDEFWVATFKKTTDVYPHVVRVYWSWSATGIWETPDRPRFAFAQASTLYKIHVIQNLTDENEPFSGAPVHDLITELTAAMRTSMFARSAP